MTRGFCLLSLCLLCCSGSSAPPASDGGQARSPVELCAALASAQCELLSRCYPAFARQSADDCRAIEQGRCLKDYEAVRASFDQGVVSVDAAKADSCVERLTHSTCPPSFPPSYSGPVVTPFPECRFGVGVLRGTVAAGDTCRDAVECQEGSVCVKQAGTCLGTCSTLAAEGEPCGIQCGEDLRCNDQGTTDVSDDRCVALGGLGAACTRSAECNASLRCSSGQCRARAGANQRCEFDPDRLSPCEAGLVCDVTPFLEDAAGSCVTPRKEGEPCRFHWSCASGLVCFDLGVKGFPTSVEPGACYAPGGADSNCPFTASAEVLGDQCGSGLWCNADSHCASLPHSGDSCVPSSQACAGLDVYCRPSGATGGGTCQGPSGIGDRCASLVGNSRPITAPCASGYCDTDTTLTCRTANKTKGQTCRSDGECLSNRCMPVADRTLQCADACT